VTGDDPDYEALKDRWERARPRTYTCAEVDERRTYKLMTITDPEVIVMLQTDEERAHLTTAPAEVNQDWRGLLSRGTTELGYDLLNIQHGHGARISVVLEADGDHVSGFKVYGLSFALQDLLSALVGVRGMRPGDTSDRGFQWHLDCLDRLVVDQRVGAEELALAIREVVDDDAHLLSVGIEVPSDVPALKQAVDYAEAVRVVDSIVGIQLQQDHQASDDGDDSEDDHQSGDNA
jgi:hypothetical protein